MRVEYSRRFIKMLAKAPANIQRLFYQRLKIFLSDFYHPRLNYHKLAGKLKQYRSINITGDWRAIFREIKKEDLIIFYLFGTHSELYK